jgi:hypothetical protein
MKHQQNTSNDHLEPKLHEVVYINLEDYHRAAMQFLRVNSMDDNSSGKMIVSGLTLSQADSSMKQQEMSRNTIKYRRRVARAFTGNDSTNDSSSGKTIVSGLSTSALLLQREDDDYLRLFFGDD